MPFGAVLRSEWTKLRTLRSTWWCAAVYVVVVLAFGWLAAAVTDQVPSAGFAVAAALTGFGFGQLVLVVLGVLAGATEFATGTAVASFAGVPRRSRLLLAKTTVVAVFAAVHHRGADGRLRPGCAHADRGARGHGAHRPRGAAPAGGPGRRGDARRRPGGGAGRAGAVHGGGVGIGLALVLVVPPLLAADGRRLTEQLSEVLPALRVGEDAFLAGADAWTAGLAAAGVWALGAWVLGAVLLERRDV